MLGKPPPAPIAVLPGQVCRGRTRHRLRVGAGREGPTVQMGATIGARVAQRGDLDDTRVAHLQGAAAGAGLAVAFNTPLGGIAFFFEELARRFSTELMVATLAACRRRRWWRAPSLVTRSTSWSRHR